MLHHKSWPTMVPTARVTRTGPEATIDIACFKTHRCFVFMLINILMPTMVGILAFMSRINSMLSWAKHNEIS